MSDASMELIKGAKKSAISDDLESNTSAEVEQSEVDIEKMTVKELDTLVKENELEVPDDWPKMVKAAKVKYLQEKYGTDAEADAAAEQGDNAEATTDTPAEPPAEAVTAETNAAGEAQSKEEAKAAAKATSKSITKSKVKDGDVLEPDDITKAVKEIENLKEGQAKEWVKSLQEKTAFDQFKLGGVLSVIQAQQWFAPYATFKEYVETELGMAYRRAAYWVKIYNKIVDNGIVWEKVKHIGWTKLKELVDVLTPDNLDEWLEAIKDKNTLTIQKMVKDAIAKAAADAATTDGEDTSSKAVTTISFKVHDDQKKIVQGAIDKAKEAGNTDVASVALEYICAEYLAGNAKPLWQRLKELGLDEAVKALDKAYPDVNFTVEGGVASE